MTEPWHVGFDFHCELVATGPSGTKGSAEAPARWSLSKAKFSNSTNAVRWFATQLDRLLIVLTDRAQQRLIEWRTESEGVWQHALLLGKSLEIQVTDIERVRYRAAVMPLPVRPYGAP